MEQKGSSLKNYNYSGMTQNEIVEKYEKVLITRENQLTEISLEVGNMNEKLNLLIDKCSRLEEENNILNSKVEKKEKTLEQELNSKEIMFQRLEKKENEYDKLKKKYDELVKFLEKNNIEISNNKKEEKPIITNENSNENITFTSAARNKIKNITARSGTNMKKLNFMELLNKKSDDNK
jgi:chromosome segregation ATPase